MCKEEICGQVTTDFIRGINSTLLKDSQTLLARHFDKVRMEVNVPGSYQVLKHEYLNFCYSQMVG